MITPIRVSRAYCSTCSNSIADLLVVAKMAVPFMVTRPILSSERCSDILYLSTEQMEPRDFAGSDSSDPARTPKAGLEDIMQKLLLSSSLALLALGCATSGKVTAAQPLTAKIEKSTPVYLKVVTQNKDFEKFVKPLQESVTASLEKKLNAQIQTRTPASKSGVMIELDITGYEGGSGAARFFNMGGEAKIQAHGQIKDLASNKILSDFDLEGTSLREKQTSVGVGGATVFNSKWVSAFDERTQMALESAGIYLAKFVAGE